MKRFILLLAILFYLSNYFSFAQNHQLGLSFSSGISGFHTIDDRSGHSSESSPIFSYGINLVYGYKINKHIGLSIEPGYLAKRNRFELTDSYAIDKKEWSISRLNYIYLVSARKLILFWSAF